MAKHGQQASWEKRRYQSPKKSEAAKVPELSKEEKHCK
ncbi:Hypothetical protein CCH01_004800 [Clostridium chauvoei JF4335]|uniref:Uncharacterized protein n=1 Tax=Clostridium chauvoei JF4335 TaxID=1351755 RepID=S6FKK6_9CLOT|nr:Hypothetical protein CCH01_004800 [Clostridium chauvoei JF4335]SLK15013.1 Hypothetical protein CCH01_07990 [Clostridium chauvoei JF4335]